MSMVAGSIATGRIQKPKQNSEDLKRGLLKDLLPQFDCNHFGSPVIAYFL